MAGVKRAYSRVQEGPWLPVQSCVASQGFVAPEEGTLVAGTYNGERYWESLPPALSTAPLYQRQVGFPQQQAQASFPTRCISAPPSGPIPLSANTKRSSLVETLTRPEPARRASAPTPTLFSLASAAVIARRTSVGDTSDAPSLISASGSTVDSSSAPPSPTTTTRTIDSKDERLARFAQRNVQNGKFGEWTAEKKDVLCAYFLTNDFPNMAQREALGKQVKLETLQVSKFFSRTRSEIKYSRTTLGHLTQQATFGMKFADENVTLVPTLTLIPDVDVDVEEAAVEAEVGAEDEAVVGPMQCARKPTNLTPRHRSTHTRLITWVLFIRPICAEDPTLSKIQSGFLHPFKKLRAA
ncbi:hypothetical protein FRC11_010999 [Ceratobasidium sp. 423]|nr:hypothetical protein FRC11_010999 [Ceratobasidium sp. 423]